MYIVQVFVPLTHDGEKGWVFKFVCPGNSMSIIHDRVLLLKNATVNRNLDFDSVCKEKQALIAVKNQPNVFEVSTNTRELVRYPLRPYLGFFSIAWDWEIEAAFFELHNITPQYTFCDTWGTLNDTTGQWSAAVGMIQRDEADYAACCFTVTHSRSKVATFTSGINYFELYWLTRYPQRLSPTWNLLGLFTQGISSQINSDQNFQSLKP